MADVQVLRMRNNMVKEIPVSVFKLELLKSVDLSRNKVVFVPEEIGYAKALV